MHISHVYVCKIASHCPGVSVANGTAISRLILSMEDHAQLTQSRRASMTIVRQTGAKRWSICRHEHYLQSKATLPSSFTCLLSAYTSSHEHISELACNCSIALQASAGLPLPMPLPLEHEQAVVPRSSCPSTGVCLKLHSMALRMSAGLGARNQPEQCAWIQCAASAFEASPPTCSWFSVDSS